MKQDKKKNKKKFTFKPNLALTNDIHNAKKFKRDYINLLCKESNLIYMKNKIILK